MRRLPAASVMLAHALSDDGKQHVGLAASRCSQNLGELVARGNLLGVEKDVVLLELAFAASRRDGRHWRSRHRADS